MATATNPRRLIKPVQGVCRWTIRPIAVRDFLVGALAINADEYTVTITRKEGQPKGVRLTKSDGTQYHVDLGNGQCDCPDHQYRGRECKHHKAVKAALAVMD